VTGIAIALATLILHAATSWRYGYFRDELYFIACSKHLAWGYVDQPPLVAVAAWLASPFGYHLSALRALPVLAAAAAAYVAMRIARDLGGGSFAQVLAGVAVALTPAYLILGNTLTTTSFEALSWTLVAWCCIRIVRGASPSWWVALAASVAFGLYGKYTMALFAGALVVALLATPQRRALATPWFPVAALLTLILVSPNLWWQAAHGWPMIEVLRGDAAHRHAFNTGLQLEYQTLWSNTLAFASEQALYTNPLALPVWLTGLIAPFRVNALRDLRFLSITYVALFAIAVVLEAKGYYIIGTYGVLLAVGAVSIERTSRVVKGAAFAALVLGGVATMPISLPVLPIGGFIGYTQLLGLTSRTQPRLMQPIYAEEYGWDRLAADVGRFYAALPAQTRARTAIYADTYADAGAIDFFGPRYGLPAAIGSQNTYWLWGPRAYDGSTLIAIGATRIDLLRKYYRNVKLIGTSDEPLKWVVEGPAPIYLCTDPVAPLPAIWPALKWYGA
jgi:hypothetical protein